MASMDHRLAHRAALIHKDPAYAAERNIPGVDTLALVSLIKPCKRNCKKEHFSVLIPELDQKPPWEETHIFWVSSFQGIKDCTWIKRGKPILRGVHHKGPSGAPQPTMGKIESQLIQTWLKAFQHDEQATFRIFFGEENTYSILVMFTWNQNMNTKMCIIKKNVQTGPNTTTKKKLGVPYRISSPKSHLGILAKLLRAALPSPGCWFIMDVMENPGIQACYP